MRIIESWPNAKKQQFNTIQVEKTNKVLGNKALSNFYLNIESGISFIHKRLIPVTQDHSPQLVNHSINPHLNSIPLIDFTINEVEPSHHSHSYEYNNTFEYKDTIASISICLSIVLDLIAALPVSIKTSLPSIDAYLSQLNTLFFSQPSLDPLDLYLQVELMQKPCESSVVLSDMQHIHNKMIFDAYFECLQSTNKGGGEVAITQV